MWPEAFRNCYGGLLQQSDQFLRLDAPAPPRPKGWPYFTRKHGFLLGLGWMEQQLPLLRLGPCTFLYGEYYRRGVWEQLPQ